MKKNLAVEVGLASRIDEAVSFYFPIQKLNFVAKVLKRISSPKRADLEKCLSNSWGQRQYPHIENAFEDAFVNIQIRTC